MIVPVALNQNRFATCWHALKRPATTDAPRIWRKWLLDEGSLTQHLIHASQGDFRVKVLRQCWGRPSRAEAQALKIPTRQKVLIREVQLLGHNQPWVFARTIIPASTLTGKQRKLHTLGTRSLGSILFRDPTMKRSPLEISRISLSNGETTWARRSLFYLANKPLLVAEVFLPALQQVNYRHK
ncbi:chorismate lyase [Amphritea sp. 2_MG-2023]|nr:chorismate lyase [Amphritea sp. 2_MG-2023]MBU2967724.1 chorismate lyase [Amphritea atlantica]MDO6416958.1 chorismate lyase [Amphritea sp. 2_MG-2023]